MDLSEESQKRKRFQQILRELAKSQDVLKEKSARAKMYRRLEELYDSPDGEHRYRHFYSDIFGILTEIKNDATLGDINILGQNLSEIRKGYRVQNTRENGEFIDIRTSINKLYDHVSLDIARMAYSDAGDWKVSGQKALSEIQNKIENLEKSTDGLKKENQKIQESSRNMQKDYVAILGIFAAVLMVFFSGIGFSASVLTNIDRASIYRVGLGIILLGTVLFNIICFLLNFISEMVNKDSISKCLIVVGNIVFVVLLGVIYLSWKYSWLGCAAF